MAADGQVQGRGPGEGRPPSSGPLRLIPPNGGDQVRSPKRGSSNPPGRGPEPARSAEPDPGPEGRAHQEAGGLRGAAEGDCGEGWAGTTRNLENRQRGHSQGICSRLHNPRPDRDGEAEGRDRSPAAAGGGDPLTLSPLGGPPPQRPTWTFPPEAAPIPSRHQTRVPGASWVPPRARGTVCSHWPVRRRRREAIGDRSSRTSGRGNVPAKSFQ